MTRTANANGVTDYTVFSSGMDTPMHSAADSRLSAPVINSQPLGGREQIALNTEVEALDFASSKTGGAPAVGPGRLPRRADRVPAGRSPAPTRDTTHVPPGQPTGAGGDRRAGVACGVARAVVADRLVLAHRLVAVVVRADQP